MTVRDRFQFISCRLGRRSLHLGVCDLNGRLLAQASHDLTPLKGDAAIDKLLDAIAAGGWDYVILQEQSSAPAMPMNWASGPLCSMSSPSSGRP